MSNYQTSYARDIKARTKFRYLKGLIPRYINYLRNSFIVWLARRRGAVIGKCVTIPYRLAMKANENLVIGDHTAIGTARLDLRARVAIGSHVIIGADVEVITVSHQVDSPDWEYKPYGITIDDYCWLATRVLILPSCQKIGRGAVCAAGAVVASDIAAVHIVAGNPAKYLRMRKHVHTNLCVEALLGNDYLAYVKAHRSVKQT